MSATPQSNKNPANKKPVNKKPASPPPASKTPASSTTAAHAALLGDESSIWFKLSPLAKGGDNPMHVLMQMSERYGSVIPITMQSQRVIILSEPEHFKHVLVTRLGKYIKYFDGLKPIFGKSMITVDGPPWQKIRNPQQPAFHPDMFVEYVPFFIAAINDKIAQWQKLAISGESVEMVEQTWTLAADMICKALFNRDMPFDPHFVFKCVKTYTDVLNHKEIRARKQTDELFEVTQEDAAKAMQSWAGVPIAVIDADQRQLREKTLLSMIQEQVDNQDFPEFDAQQALDEIKQYLWAGTETTALTLAWALYLTSRHPEASERIRREGEEVYGSRDPTAADYSGLAYTRAVIQETMRLYPPVWALIRTCNEADEIDGKQIKPGDQVMLFSYGAHHSPRFWTDPEKFDPERFMGERMKKRVKYSYLPLGGGRRSCIGGAMSQLENTLALSILLRRFRPEYVGAEPPGINATVTLTPKGGLNFKIFERD